jgi:metallo-beta-lactamase family protein
MENCIAIGKMFTMISDYKDIIDTIYTKPKVVIAASNGDWRKLCHYRTP